jgi:hypothetical protein
MYPTSQFCVIQLYHTPLDINIDIESKPVVQLVGVFLLQWKDLGLSFKTWGLGYFSLAKLASLIASEVE